MTAPTRQRTAAQTHAEIAARARIVDRLRAQFPELGESEIQDAVGEPTSVHETREVTEFTPTDGAQVSAVAAPRRHRA